MQVFNWLPLAAHVENKILCMHGGIGRSINRIKQIEVLYRPLTMEQGGVVLMDLLWSDPTTNDGVQVPFYHHTLFKLIQLSESILSHCLDELSDRSAEQCCAHHHRITFKTVALPSCPICALSSTSLQSDSQRTHLLSLCAVVWSQIGRSFWHAVWPFTQSCLQR